MDARLRKSIKVYRELVLRIPYSTRMNTAPEFREAKKYRNELFREFGEKAVLQAMREIP